jgi:hypothetical protein
VIQFITDTGHLLFWVSGALVWAVILAILLTNQEPAGKVRWLWNSLFIVTGAAATLVALGWLAGIVGQIA